MTGADHDEHLAEGYDIAAYGDAPAVLDMLASAASRLIGRVLDAVHEDLSKLLTADDLQLDFVIAARPHFSGKDEAAELQVLFCSKFCVKLEVSLLSTNLHQTRRPKLI